METGRKIKSFFDDYPTRNLSKNSIFIEPDDKIINIYYLKTGYVRSYSISAKGGEFTLNIYNPHTFFPITTILSGNKQSRFFFSTLTDCRFSVAPAADVLVFLKKNPDAVYDLLERTSSGLEGLLQRIEGIINTSASEKIASTLFLLAKKYGVEKSDKTICIEFPHTHETLSTLAGLTRETTSLQVKEFERSGVIKRINKKTCVLNLTSLKEQFI